MADNFLLFSTAIPLKDGSHVDAAAAILNQFETDRGDDGFTWSVEGPAEQTDGQQLSGTGFIELYADEHGDVEKAAEAIQRLLDADIINEPVIMRWAETCSKPRHDEFGGGAFLVTKTNGAGPSGLFFDPGNEARTAWSEIVRDRVDLSHPAPSHNHVTRDIKELGDGCPACDYYHANHAKRSAEAKETEAIQALNTINEQQAITLAECKSDLMLRDNRIAELHNKVSDLQYQNGKLETEIVNMRATREKPKVKRKPIKKVAKTKSKAKRARR